MAGNALSVKRGAAGGTEWLAAGAGDELGAGLGSGAAPDRERDERPGAAARMPGEKTAPGRCSKARGSAEVR